jgi:hypothetical protein
MKASFCPVTRTVTSAVAEASESVSAPPQSQLASECANTCSWLSVASSVVSTTAVIRASVAMTTSVTPNASARAMASESAPAAVASDSAFTVLRPFVSARTWTLRPLMSALPPSVTRVKLLFAPMTEAQSSASPSSFTFAPAPKPLVSDLPSEFASAVVRALATTSPPASSVPLTLTAVL